MRPYAKVRGDKCGIHYLIRLGWNALYADLIVVKITVEKMENLVVIKVGGELLDAENIDSVVSGICALKRSGRNAVVVHGGGKELSELMKKIGKEPVFSEGLRVTDSETIALAQMAFLGPLKTKLISSFLKNGEKAVGISGRDAGFVVAKKKTGKADLGFVGTVERIDVALIELLLSKNYVPVISPFGFSKRYGMLNINADELASSVAIAMKADEFLVLTNVDGILRNRKDASSLIAKITKEECGKLISNGVISEGMIPKAQACISALSGGARIARIANGKKKEAFVENGGTMVA